MDKECLKCANCIKELVVDNKDGVFSCCIDNVVVIGEWENTPSYMWCKGDYFEEK
jgi:hypothetical protein